MQSLHLRGGGGEGEGAYWIQGIYSRVGVYEMIYGKHVAPGKHVYWKNDAIMQIEVNLINNVWKTRKKKLVCKTERLTWKFYSFIMPDCIAIKKKTRALSRSCLAYHQGFP